MGRDPCPVAPLRFSEIRLRLLISQTSLVSGIFARGLWTRCKWCWKQQSSYRPIAPAAANAIRRAGTHKVLDLLPHRRTLAHRRAGRSGRRCCSADKYPSPSAANGNGAGTRAAGTCAILWTRRQFPRAWPASATIFSSFHHFPHAEALGFLRDSAEKRRGVGVFEVASRLVLTMLVICLIPVLDWIATPFRRPFRWSRLLWTYVLPVVPFVLFFDGLVSCLRTHSLSDLRAMTNGLSSWEIGEEKGGRIPVLRRLPGGISEQRGAGTSRIK